MLNRHNRLNIMIGVDHLKWWGFRLLKTWIIRTGFFCHICFFFQNQVWHIIIKAVDYSKRFFLSEMFFFSRFWLCFIFVRIENEGPAVPQPAGCYLLQEFPNFRSPKRSSVSGIIMITNCRDDEMTLSTENFQLSFPPGCGVTVVTTGFKASESVFF